LIWDGARGQVVQDTIANQDMHSLLAHYQKIGMKVLSKECSKCKAERRNNTPVQKHECPENYSGSSKSIKVQAIYEMAVEAWESGSHAFGTIVSNNNTTMKAQLKHLFKCLIEARKMNKTDWPRKKRRSEEE